VKFCKTPNEWQTGVIIPIFKMIEIIAQTTSSSFELDVVLMLRVCHTTPTQKLLCLHVFR